MTVALISLFLVSLWQAIIIAIARRSMRVLRRQLEEVREGIFISRSEAEVLCAVATTTAVLDELKDRYMAKALHTKMRQFVERERFK